MGIIFWILVGLIAGWLTGKIMKGSGYGFFVDIILGMAGAMVGGFHCESIWAGQGRKLPLQHAGRAGRRGHPGGRDSLVQENIGRHFPLKGKCRSPFGSDCWRNLRSGQAFDSSRRAGTRSG